ncbi:class I SAM-dependent DNA methyltransferase [Alkalibacillus haloalkaliphilus]|uniref:Uncharacterized methyltransferase AHA02nite_01610 n=1 Tax=Alkalibacillus haloalkaliphilus TaxID=94136 RepID=A0A511W008_9BACI|nr:class I SAM-dependent methyltransferase [Alkalibacillus haloalkaliphilus]GEN44385.1 putative methyltransferase [Alkalibacillus haloalkaliphilus]
MGREFMHIFDEWADSYETTVQGRDEQYKAVFEHYDDILEEVAKRTNGITIEFGIGTGNLTEKVLQKGVELVAVEPNKSMRLVAEKRFPYLTIHDGDFLSFPKLGKVDSIISSYAFHHLTDEEKKRAFELYYSLLSESGEIVFADTMFVNEQAHEEMITTAKAKQFFDLAEDLNREYYTTVPNMKKILHETGYQVQFEKLNDFVWLTHAKKS